MHIWMIGRYTSTTHRFIDSNTNESNYKILRSRDSTFLRQMCSFNNDYWWCGHDSSSTTELKWWSSQINHWLLYLRYYGLVYCITRRRISAHSNGTSSWAWVSASERCSNRCHRYISTYYHSRECICVCWKVLSVDCWWCHECTIGIDIGKYLHVRVETEARWTITYDKWNLWTVSIHLSLAW